MYLKINRNITQLAFYSERVRNNMTIIYSFWIFHLCVLFYLRVVMTFFLVWKLLYTYSFQILCTWFLSDFILCVMWLFRVWSLLSIVCMSGWISHALIFHMQNSFIRRCSEIFYISSMTSIDFCDHQSKSICIEKEENIVRLCVVIYCCKISRRITF